MRGAALRPAAPAPPPDDEAPAPPEVQPPAAPRERGAAVEQRLGAALDGAEELLVDLAQRAGLRVAGQELRQALAFVLPRIRSGLGSAVELIRLAEPPERLDRFGMDPRFAERFAPVAELLYRTWWRTAVREVTRVPASPPAIVVANHAGLVPWDALRIMAGRRDGSKLCLASDSPDRRDEGRAQQEREGKQDPALQVTRRRTVHTRPDRRAAVARRPRRSRFHSPARGRTHLQSAARASARAERRVHPTGGGLVSSASVMASSSCLLAHGRAGAIGCQQASAAQAHQRLTRPAPPSYARRSAHGRASRAQDVPGIDLSPTR